MSLSRDTLFQGFMDVVNGVTSGSITIDTGSFPRMPDNLALAFAQAYDTYAQDATADTLTISSRGDVDTLQKNFEDEKLGSWAAGVGVYWAGTSFKGDGFVDDNRVTQESNTKMIGDLAVDIDHWVNNTGSDHPNGPTQGTDRLVGILHDRTLELIVKRTTADASGTVDTVPIS